MDGRVGFQGWRVRGGSHFNASPYVSGKPNLMWEAISRECSTGRLTSDGCGEPQLANQQTG
jgi:hypothetical protein